MKTTSLLFLSAAFCLTAAPLPRAAETTPVVVSTLAHAAFLSEARIETLRQRVAAHAEPNYSAFLQLRKEADAALARPAQAPKVWHVPRRYVDRDGHYKAKDGLMNDANNAYELALCHRILGEPRYAIAAARLINAWTRDVKELKTTDDSQLSFTYHFPAMIFAADLLRNAPEWPAAEQAAFRTFVREKALPMNTMERDNNWGNWGIVLVAASAAYLDDRPLLEKAAQRWKELIAIQIDAAGHLKHEVTRNDGTGSHGLWYSHFSLMPAVLGAEILRVNGIDLFDYRSPEGRTLNAAFLPLAAWSNNLASFPYFKGDPAALYEPDYYSYFEILNARWPNTDATALLRQKRPLTAIHSAPWLTFTHGEPLPTP